MDPADFVRQNTAITAPPLVPEIRLHLATEVTPIWQATEESLACNGLPPPFWAFAWAGGQSLARYVLDHPETVAGREVLDFGSGSAIPVALIAPLPAFASLRVTTCRPAANWKAPSASPASYGASCRIWGGTAEPSENHRGRGARHVADLGLGIELLPAGGVGRP